jgi:Uma2 family endonuclease
MSMSVAQLTPDALLSLPELEEGGHYELSDGELIVVGTAGALHEFIKMTLVRLLMRYEFRTSNGSTFSETQFALGTERARVPDVAWVSKERLLLIPRENRAIAIAPDIAIEIVSESEQLKKTEQKLRDYLEADVEVWQVFPATQTVTVWRGNLGVRLTGEQILTSERLPDFGVTVADIFV